MSIFRTLVPSGASWGKYCDSPSLVYVQLMRRASQCHAVCQKTNIPAKDKPAEEDSLMSVWLWRSLPTQCLISAHRAAKGQNSCLLALSCPMRQMFGFERSSAGCSSLPFTAILRRWAGKKPVMVLSLSTGWNFHFLSRSCCSQEAHWFVCYYKSVSTFPQRLNYVLWL